MIVPELSEYFKQKFLTSLVNSRALIDDLGNDLMRALTYLDQINLDEKLAAFFVILDCVLDDIEHSQLEQRPISFQYVT